MVNGLNAAYDSSIMDDIEKDGAGLQGMFLRRHEGHTVAPQPAVKPAREPRYKTVMLKVRAPRIVKSPPKVVTEALSKRPGSKGKK